MTFRKRPVAVMQFPERFSREREVRNFAREVERSHGRDAPLPCARLFECAVIWTIQSVNLLLALPRRSHEAQWRRQACRVPLTATRYLVTGTNRLFEIFDTTADAVNSFHQLPFDNISEAEQVGECSVTDFGFGRECLDIGAFGEDL